jgi:hypothetical protein
MIVGKVVRSLSPWTIHAMKPPAWLSAAIIMAVLDFAAKMARGADEALITIGPAVRVALEEGHTPKPKADEAIAAVELAAQIRTEESD